MTVMNAFIVSTLVFQFVNGAANVPAHPYHPSIADLANFEHTFCKKEQTTAEKDILCNAVSGETGTLRGLPKLPARM